VRTLEKKSRPTNHVSPNGDRFSSADKSDERR
jgi:hypothetical protein